MRSRLSQHFRQVYVNSDQHLATMPPIAFVKIAKVLRPHVKRCRGGAAAACRVVRGNGGRLLFGSSFVLLPIMVIAGQWWFPWTFDNGTIATLIAVAINATFLVLFFEIIRRAGPTFFAQFNYLAVLAGVAWGAIVFGERLTLTFFLAMVLMFVGVFLSGYRRQAA